MTTKVVTVDDLSTRTCPAPKHPNSTVVCNAVLRASNKTGYCRLHFHYSKKKHPPVGPAATSTPRAHSGNGNHHLTPTKPSNGRTSLIQLNVTEDQLNSFFLRLSIAERALIVNTYLAGGR